MKLNEKLEKVNDNFTVYMYDNGFMPPKTPKPLNISRRQVFFNNYYK